MTFDGVVLSLLKDGHFAIAAFEIKFKCVVTILKQRPWRGKEELDIPE
jgi:hypothetical protein